MRTAVLLGLVFIGDNIGRGLHAELVGDPTTIVVLALVFCVWLDVFEVFKGMFK